jgi:hypothetical protein
MPQTSQKEVTVRLRGKFAFQIAGIENRLAGLMQAGFAGINHEIYRTLVGKVNKKTHINQRYFSGV